MARSRSNLPSTWKAGACSIFLQHFLVADAVAEIIGTRKQGLAVHELVHDPLLEFRGAYRLNTPPFALAFGLSSWRW